MIKRIVPLVLLAAWIPQAHAFPPCPLEPMEYGPPPDGVVLSATAGSVAAKSATDAAPWFRADYQFVGDPTVIDQIAPTRAVDIIADPTTGKCRDRDGLSALNSHVSPGTLHLNPRYAPRSGFGIIDLPYLPAVAADGLNVEYRLKFTVENVLLQNPADWLDVAQLDFFRNGSAGSKYELAVASVYRVRKIQNNDSHASIEIIESRATPGGIGSKPMIVDHVVATIPLRTGSQTEIGLQWTQTARPRNEAQLVHDEYDIDVVFDVIGPDDRVLYTTPLPGQWASLVSMGLLDYNIGDASAYEKGHAIEFSNMTLSATQHH